MGDGKRLVVSVSDPTDTITFAELLTRLGFGTGTSYRSNREHVSVCHRLVGRSFKSEVRQWDHAPPYVTALLEQ